MRGTGLYKDGDTPRSHFNALIDRLWWDLLECQLEADRAEVL